MPVPAEVGSAANNYQILGRLAVGGMAEIFLARGESTAGVERHCVLKRILRERATDLHFVRMFLDEARLAAQLNHPNVAQVYDIGKLADSYFFTMEYVHGETVRAVIQRARSLRREMPLGAVLTMAAGAAAGLHHAHERVGLDGRPLGIVHRDVSPSNLMVSFEGGVKVVDFGVAKAADRASETRSGTVKGKISYLSPEQCRSTQVDRRTDLFALGIVLWEMLTLERLYRRASDFENMNAIVNEPPSPPSSRQRSVPPELDAIVLRLLAKRPEERFQTADEVIGALEDASAATGAMISSSSLGRLMREMFGQRPEPWLEMEAQDVPEGVTVTSEPIPMELGFQPADSLDLQLAGVPDLGADRAVMTQDDGVSLPPGAAAPRYGMAEAPATVPEVPPELAGRRTGPVEPQAVPGSGGYPTARGRHATPPSGAHAVSRSGGHAMAGGRHATPPSGAHAVPRSGGYAAPGSGGHAAPGSGGYAAPGSGGHAAPGSGGYAAPRSASASGSAAAAAPSSGGYVALRSLPSAAAVVALEGRAEERAEKPARGWPMLAVILAAMVIGSLAVLLVMKTGGGSAPGADEAAAPGSAPVAAQAPAAAPVPAPTPAPSVAPIDADPGAAAGEPAAPVDAQAAGSAAGTEVDAGAPEPPKPPIEAAMDGQRYDEVVAICSKRFPQEQAAICALAACHARSESKARAWFSRAPAGERPRLIGLCRSLGIDPVSTRRPAPPKPPTSEDDKCERNPMACQH